MYDETIGKKTPNESVSFLYHYIEQKLEKNMKTLYIFSDNCEVQNKSFTMASFLYALLQNGRLKNIVHRLPEPRHSFLPCDRCFGVVEKYRVTRI